MTLSGRGRAVPPVAAAVTATLALACLVSPVVSCAAVAADATTTTDPSSWPSYHGDAAGSGVSSAAVSVDTSHRAWTSLELDGALYGEPLVTGGRVYVATEDDRVYALSGTNGSVLWSTRVGVAVPSSSLPCGDIAPTVGITGTPVVDEQRGEIFVVADELVAGSAEHWLVGLDTASGRVELAQRVDPPGALATALLQRTGLALDEGRVVFGFGGNYGDCSAYRGWVVAVGESGGAPRDFAVTPSAEQGKGAVWMGGGAPAVDSEGNVWVTAGNGSVVSPRQPYDGSDSVLELSPLLKLEQFFAPGDWAADNAADRDLSMEPVLLSDGQVVAAGKSRTAYLLDGTHLGGIGGQQAASPSICGDDVNGGGATVGTIVYLPCTSGVVAVRVSASPPTITPLWSSSAGGGPPIVAGGLVWTVGPDGKLSGLDPDTGSVRQRTSVGPSANHFPTPSMGDGVLLVPSARQVVAFAATPAAVPGPASTRASGPRTRPTPSTTTAEGSGGWPPAAFAGLAVGGALAMGLVIFLVLHRRGRAAGPGAGPGR